MWGDKTYSVHTVQYMYGGENSYAAEQNFWPQWVNFLFFPLDYREKARKNFYGSLVQSQVSILENLVQSQAKHLRKPRPITGQHLRNPRPITGQNLRKPRPITGQHLRKLSTFMT